MTRKRTNFRVTFGVAAALLLAITVFPPSCWGACRARGST